MATSRIDLNQRTIHEVHVMLPDEIIDDMRDATDVELYLHSNSRNREPSPIKLSYATVHRLVVDI